MPLQLRATRLPLDRIDLNDDTYALTVAGIGESDPALAASIAETEILHPPIVQEKGNNTYRVVAGRKRLQAIRTSRTSCECLVLAANTNPVETLITAFEETRISREPTPLEKAVFLSKGLRWLDEEQVAQRLLPRLPGKGGVRQLQRTVKLLDLEEPILAALHTGRLDETVARELGEMSFGDRLALFDLIDLLALSVGNQKKLVAGCRELAIRHDTSVINILNDQELRDILAHEGSNNPQKAGHLMAWLGKLRSPRLSAAERDFQTFRGKLALPKGVNVSHAQSFEKETVTLEIEFADREELERRWPALLEILER